jgi:hypothetical protein
MHGLHRRIRSLADRVAASGSRQTSATGSRPLSDPAAAQKEQSASHRPRHYQMAHGRQDPGTGRWLAVTPAAATGPYGPAENQWRSLAHAV